MFYFAFVFDLGAGLEAGMGVVALPKETAMPLPLTMLFLAPTLA